MANFVVVRVNKNYRASVYELGDLKRYIESNPSDVDLNVLAVETRPNFDGLLKNDAYAKQVLEIQQYVDSLKNPPKKQPSSGWQFGSWADAMAEYRRQVADELKLWSGKPVRFQHYGLAWVDTHGNPSGATGAGMTLREAKEMAENPEATEVYLDGRVYVYEDWPDYFNDRNGEPTDSCVSVTVWKRASDDAQ